MIAKFLAVISILLDLVTSVVKKLLLAGFLIILMAVVFITSFAILIAHFVN